MIKNKGCCDLKYALRLKELGVKQESEWYWMRGHTSPVPKPQFAFKEMIGSKDKGMLCSAPTVAELGEMLPREIGSYRFIIEKLSWGWQTVYYDFITKDIIGEGITDNTLANAMAKMKIWLIENKDKP